jgi:hypothetical protein
MQNNKWKDYLLKSGLPLEFEVKKVLDKLGFWSKNEFSYFRENENNILTEFSYDIDSEILVADHCFELLIECKYRDESTNWLFLPEEYNDSTRGIGTTDFRNTNDFFYPKEYSDLFKVLNIIKVSPLCSKGIEICTTGQNPKTIDQAISQISYGIVDKVILAMEKQLKAEEEELFIYHHVPVIVTTANLLRLNKNVTIESIKAANEIHELSSNHDILLVEPTLSLDLKKYAYRKLSEFEAKYTSDYLNERLNPKFKKHGRDFAYYKDEIASFPNGVVVMTHSQNGQSFKKLLNAFWEIAQPSKKVTDKIEKLFSDVDKYVDE